MSRYIGIWILFWVLFRFVFHCISYDKTKLGELLYFGGNDIIQIGVFWSILSIINKVDVRFFWMRRYQLKRLVKTVLIYSIWCFIVDILLFFEIGAHDSMLYTAVDIVILGIGTLWAIFA
jgi:hypothetical protein